MAQRHGGHRPGAGRPRGSPNTLAYGEVRALKACNLRVPENAPAPVAALANRALERVVEVLEGQVHHTMAGHVLRAATILREEACGPLANRVAVTGGGEQPLEIIVRTLRHEAGEGA